MANTTGTRTRRATGRQTRESTLYRLGEWADLQESAGYLTETALNLSEDLAEVTLAPDVPGVLFHGQGAVEQADWCRDLSLTCGVDVRHDKIRAGAVLFLRVDGVIYAVTYGSGYTWLDASVKDERFGLSVVIRCVNSDEIVDVVRSSLWGKGRTDSTLVPDGIPVTMLRIDKQADLIKRLAGKALLPTTFSDCGGEVTVRGSAGLRMRFGVRPGDLVADIRAVASVLAAPVHPELAFVDDVVPVHAQATLADLDDALESLLAAPGSVPDALSLAIPESCLAAWARKQSVGLRVGSVASRTTPDLSLDEILRRARLQSDGQRLSALRGGTVELFADRQGHHSLGRSPAGRWVQAHVSLGARRFVRSEDQWYELGVDFLAKLRAEVTKILAAGSGTLALPGWRRRPDGTYEEEKEYNHRVADCDPGFVHMDRRLVQMMPGRSSGIEMCDLLGPGDELIHVKRAKGSAELSHLFTQAAVSERLLRDDPEVRKAFVALAAKRRMPPEDFVPKKIVYAILLKDGEVLSPDTLFPFAQVALCQAVDELRGRVAVEVVGIRVEAPAGDEGATTGRADAGHGPRPHRGRVRVPGTPR